MTGPKLTALKPIPTSHIDPDLSDDPKGEKVSTLVTVKKALRKIQKWSLLPVGAFLSLHGINTLLLPAIDPSSLPNDALMMIREVNGRLGSTLIWTGITTHVLSGLILRLIKRIYQPHSHRINSHLATIDSESISQTRIGLVGGLSGYFIGIKRNLQYNPQVVTGWLLAPLVFFHGTLMKWAPNHGKVDIDFDFVKWMLNENRSPLLRFVLGYIPLIALIGFGTYHTIAGTVQYLRVRGLKARRSFLHLILLLTGTGVFGLTRLGSQWIIGMDKYYQPILKTLWLC